MNLKFREYRPEDQEQAAAAWSTAFRGGVAMPAEEFALDADESAFVAECDGSVVGAFTIHDMKCTRGDATLSCAGIAAVAVLPEYRRLNVAGEMMEWALQLMRANGAQMSSLYAFRESYYRKYGWECAGARHRITCPNYRFPKTPLALPMRRLALGEWKQIEGCYQSFARRYSGMNIRDEAQWKRVLSGGETPANLYAVGEPVSAYAVVRMAKDFWGEQNVSEMAWSDKAGYEAILSVLAGIMENRASMKWYEPSDGPFLSHYYDQGVEAEIVRPIMFRVVNVPVALGSLRPCASGEFTFAVADSLAENRGPWRVCFGEEGVEVSPSSSADMNLTVQALSQAVLGQPSFEQLLKNGRIDCNSEKAAHAARALLPPRPTYCMDFF